MYTCSVCHIEVDYDDIMQHACMVESGCETVKIDNNNWFNAVLGEEESSQREPPKKRSRGSSKLTPQEIEILILEVQKREVLWDFTRRPEARDRDVVRRQWEEVAIQLKGKLTAEEAKVKFKNLRDTHRKIINAESHPSGSARVEPKQKWRFYDVMEFLRDSCLLRDSSTNVPEDHNNEIPNSSASVIDGDNDSELSSIQFATPRGASERISTKAKKNVVGSRPSSSKSSGSGESPALDRLVEVLAREPQQVVLPPVPIMDTVDCILQAAGLEIKKIKNNSARMKLLMDIMSMVNARVEEYDDLDYL